MKRIMVGLTLGVMALFSVVSFAQAFDGEVSLTNRVGEDARCWATTVLMQDQTYKILLSCRDITYPGGNSVFYYVVWANPVSGGAAIRLGSLGLGKAEFGTKTEFNSLFVTKEPGQNVGVPSGTIIMQGTLRSVPILEELGKNTATNTNVGTPSPIATPIDEVVITPIPSVQPRTGVAKLLTSGILAILGIAGLIFVVFFVTKR